MAERKLCKKGGVISGALDFIFPPACPICGEASQVKNGVRLDVCTDCKNELVYITDNRCMKCGKELSKDEIEYCYDCGRQKHDFAQSTSVFVYTETIKESIYRFKYKNCQEYAGWYGRQMAQNCGNLIRMWDISAILPVPIHKSRLKKRGYNQAGLIAVALGEQMGIRVDETSLVRNKKTVPMKELDGEERIKNLENAFIICEDIRKYRNVLLVDDIYTTGATFDACSRVLKAAGVGNVYCISLCIGRGI